MYRGAPKDAHAEVDERIRFKPRNRRGAVDSDFPISGQRRGRLKHLANPKRFVVAEAIRHHPIFAQTAKPLFTFLTEQVIAHLFGRCIRVSVAEYGGVRI
jgi:hypothetical protein